MLTVASPCPDPVNDTMMGWLPFFFVACVFWGSVDAKSARDLPGPLSRERPTQADMRTMYEKRYGGPVLTQCEIDRHERDSPTLPEEDGTVHEIWLQPHTHDDVGWEWTVRGYFDNFVNAILDSVTADLGAHPDHRFIWSEIKWIEMWWPLQNASTQYTFKRIVSNGQLEFVGAGWSQHDEVTPSYRDMVTNTVTGHEFLRTILGPLDQACPGPRKVGRGRCIRFGWQIDMFAGYSAASPSLCAMAGYDGMVLRFEGPDSMRVEWDKKQDYELLWGGSGVLKKNRSLMATHIMRWNYGDMLLVGRNGSAYGYRGPAVSFAFDTRVLKTPDDVERYATELVYWSRHRGSVYRGNRHLAVWGSDFQFTNAGLWFEQMDQLIAEINGNPQKYNARIRYTTLSEYFDHLHQLQEESLRKSKADVLRDRARQLQRDVNTFPLPVKELLDFEFGWPHSWSPIGDPLLGLTQNFSIQYQTGAPSSRPNHKRSARANAALLRTAQTAHAVAVASGALKQSKADEFMVAWDALGVMQHHDSMPATMRAYESVVCPDNMPIIDGLDSCNRTTDPTRQCLEDYTARLVEAKNASTSIVMASLEAMTGVQHLQASPALDSNAMLVFNPTGQSRTEIIRFEFPMGHGNILPTVYRLGAKGSQVPIVAQIEINDRLETQLTVSHIAPPLCANALYFLAEDIPPLGTASFVLEFGSTNSTTTVVPDVLIGAEQVAKEGLGFTDDPLCQRVHFNPTDGLMEGLEVRSGGVDCSVSEEVGENTITMAVKQAYWQYLDGPGGAYCLIEQAPAVPVPPPFRVALTKGPILQEVVQSFAFGSGLTQRVRLIKGGEWVEVVHSSGRLLGNRELVSRFETDLINNATVHTEASGFCELYPRKFNDSASIGQNYHSMVQTAVIRDENNGADGRQLSLLTRRTMGVASLQAGEMEYMLARRITTQSDNQGPWPLDDRLPQEDVVRFVLSTVGNGELKRFTNALELEHPLATYYYNRESESSEDNHIPKTNMPPFPSSVWFEIFERLDAPRNSTFALRLQNVVADGPDEVIPSLKDALGALGIPSILGCVEMTSTLQQSRQENEVIRLQWSADADEGKSVGAMSKTYAGCDDAISLSPLDIRTFTFSVP